MKYDLTRGRTYWWTLAGLSAILVLSLAGLGAVWLSPRPPEPNYLVIPKFSSPVFTFQWIDRAEDARWSAEEEISDANGRKVLRLVRGSQTLAEVYKQNHVSPEEAFRRRHMLDYTCNSVLTVYQKGKPKPVFEIRFHEPNLLVVNRKTYVVRRSQREELRDILAVLDGRTLFEEAR